MTDTRTTELHNDDWLTDQLARLSTYESIGTPEEFEAYEAEHEAVRRIKATTSPVSQTVCYRWLLRWAADLFRAHDNAERVKQG